ncbi:hypothetical protein Hypma_013749 [Hypsizygus marmoreus]|uniref:Uncharacterized protein n=1 Tax=Hypsizygus marmoreus TaxID=39966 RepID=A0A369KA72_HYPMA|nr:hypothetical protein Hypma_013749 [Hypsizygus marmoreus]
MPGHIPHPSSPPPIVSSGASSASMIMDWEGYPVAFSVALFSLCTGREFVFTYGFSTDGLVWMTFIPRKDVFSSDSSETIQSTATAKARVPRPRRIISTLDPSRLQDRDFIDLSPEPWNPRNPRGQVPRIVAVPPITQQTSSPPSRRRSFQIYYNVPGVGHHFPENSHGFFYYHRDPQLPPTSGALRFRLTRDAHASSFSAGTDLMSFNGRGPWAIWLVAVASAAKYVGLKQLLLSDGLVAPELMEHCRKLVVGIGGSGVSRIYHCMLFTLEQPFVLDLATSSSLSVMGPLHIEKAQMRFTKVQTIERSKRKFIPYSGQCMVRFERSLAPEHAGKRVAVIRVLEILTPIVSTDPTCTPRNKGGLFRMPTVGSLLVKGDRPITIKADGDSRLSRCLRLLM